MPKQFCTAISCMDGRIQLPVIAYLQDRFNAEFVDVITEAGPNLILATRERPELVESILARASISVNNHHSVGIAVTGHHDCAGNPAPEAEQVVHVGEAVDFLQQHYGELPVMGLWVDEKWQVYEVHGRHPEHEH